jgi:Amt family ammonium transporter
MDIMGVQISAGDTAWILVCCSLVLLMTPALAFFYGGMVRRKNVLSTLTLSYIFMSLIGVQWVLYGYSLSFGPDISGLILLRHIINYDQISILIRYKAI